MDFFLFRITRSSRDFYTPMWRIVLVVYEDLIIVDVSSRRRELRRVYTVRLQRRRVGNRDFVIIAELFRRKWV